MTRSTRDLPQAVASDLRLFRFAATNDDTEFYVRARSQAEALNVLMERFKILGLKPHRRTITALDKVKL